MEFCLSSCKNTTTNVVAPLASVNITELEKPSLEVEQTTLRLVLLTYSLQFRSPFPPRSRVRFSQFYCFTFSRKGSISSSDTDDL